MEKTFKVTVKTETDFKIAGMWNEKYNVPDGWNIKGRMNYLLGKTIEITAKGWDSYKFHDEKNDFRWTLVSADFTNKD